MNESLKHHGVLGQKWGVRRYQPYPKGYKGDGNFVGKSDDGKFYTTKKDYKKYTKKLIKDKRDLDLLISTNEHEIKKIEKKLSKNDKKKGALLDKERKSNKLNTKNILKLNRRIDIKEELNDRLNRIMVKNDINKKARDEFVSQIKKDYDLKFKKVSYNKDMTIKGLINDLVIYDGEGIGILGLINPMTRKTAKQFVNAEYLVSKYS